MMKVPLADDKSRPEFMITLGLLPPYTLSDVKAAYRVKAMETHPDRGGAAADFIKIHEAYKQATEYIQITGERRKWIADQVEVHLRQQELADEVTRLGGRTEFEEVHWLKPYVGDFVLLADRLRVIHLQNTAADDAFLSDLAQQPSRAPHLIELNLAGTEITDEGLQTLTGLEQLRRLDLSGTRITDRGFRAVVESLPALEWVGTAGTKIGWLARWRLRGRLRERQSEKKRMKLLIPPLEKSASA